MSNGHVHPLFQPLLRAFAPTVIDESCAQEGAVLDAARRAELQAEHIVECRADDREARALELAERGGA